MLSSKFITEHLSQYGERVLECPVYISGGIHDKQNQQVLRSACALLNSGGGLLHMHNVEHAGKVQSKDLDTWWSGMESNLADMLSSDDICNYLDFVGSFDDPHLYLFVKTADHLCTLNYHCRLPTDTATHTVTYTSAVKLLGKTGQPSPLDALPPVLTEYQYGQVETTLKQEGKQIQFKLLASTRDQAKTFADRVRQYSVKYVSAFANHYGGHVYFGIEDATAAVLGEIMEPGMESKITQRVQRMMGELIWADCSVKVERGKHWDIHFYPVSNCPLNVRRCVVVVSVVKFPGGVFTSCPESYVVSDSGQLQQLSFLQWKTEVLSQSRVRADLQTRFVKIPLQTPFSRQVYSLPHTLQAAREKVLKLCPGLNLQPPQYLSQLGSLDAHLATCVRRLLHTFADDSHLAVPLQCWGTHFPGAGHEDLLTSLLVLSQVYGVHLVLLTTSYLNASQVWEVGRELTVRVKHRLVTQGGCTDRLAIHLHTLSVADPLMVQNFQVAIDSSIYPATYTLTAQKMNNILTALLISIAAYSPCYQQDTPPTPTLAPTPTTGVGKKGHHHHHTPSQSTSNSTGQSAAGGGGEVHFLLTCDQLQLLWTRQFTKELWVHGPPGAGKTVAALTMARELVDRGCSKDQVLYLAENPLLCAYVRSFELCQVVSRRELLEDYGGSPGRFHRKYGAVTNVLVDEAQNFKDRDGDWYALAQQLAGQGAQDVLASTPQPAPLSQAATGSQQPHPHASTAEPGCESITTSTDLHSTSTTMSCDGSENITSQHQPVTSTAQPADGSESVDYSSGRKTPAVSPCRGTEGVSENTGFSVIATDGKSSINTSAESAQGAGDALTDNKGVENTTEICSSGDAADSSWATAKLSSSGGPGAPSPAKRPRAREEDLRSGYFWVFMDYAQKVHKFRAGLPGLIGKNNFMLSEISRNSKEIFDYAMKFMAKPSEAVPQGKQPIGDNPVLGHDYQNGKPVEVLRCSKDSVHRTLFSVLESYLGSGTQPDDIAILVSKARDKDQLQKCVQHDFVPTVSADSDTVKRPGSSVTVHTVRSFSGLDKPVVIGLEPHTDANHADLDKFIVNLATRAKDGLVIITTSDQLMSKLQIQ